MKIVYIVKSNLHTYPPCMSQIRSIKKLGYEIEVWYGSSDSVAIDILKAEEISSICLNEKRLKLNGILSRLYNWYDFRRSVKKRIRLNKDNSIYWYGTTETCLPMLGIINKNRYIVTSLELNDDYFLKRKLYGVIARDALAVVACELSRAFIMRYWYDLKDVPYVMPNKPFELSIEKNAVGTINQSKQAIKQLQGNPFIIYQGIFQNTEMVEEIAYALKAMNSKYFLVLMGTNYHDPLIIEKLKRIYNKVVFFESIPAPKHLEVTSHASIGIVFYDGMTLNKAFCAPNKIYEYSYFGIPCLSNRIPGLVNTVESQGFGKCVDMKREKIAKAISEIEENYDTYSKNGRIFYAKTDNISTMRDLLNNVSVKR